MLQWPAFNGQTHPVNGQEQTADKAALMKHLLFAALALHEVHPALLSLVRLSIQLCKPLLTLPALLKLLLLRFGFVIILVCDLHELHKLPGSEDDTLKCTAYVYMLLHAHVCKNK